VNVFDETNQKLCNQVTDCNGKYSCPDLPAGVTLQVIFTDSNNMEVYNETIVLSSDHMMEINVYPQADHAPPDTNVPGEYDEFIF